MLSNPVWNHTHTNISPLFVSSSQIATSLCLPLLSTPIISLFSLRLHLLPFSSRVQHLNGGNIVPLSELQHTDWSWHCHTHTQTQSSPDSSEQTLYPHLHQPATPLRCKFKSQLPFSSKAMPAQWTSGIWKSGNCFWQFIVFTCCAGSTMATGRCRPRRD